MSCYLGTATATTRAALLIPTHVSSIVMYPSFLYRSKHMKGSKEHY